MHSLTMWIVLCHFYPSTTFLQFYIHGIQSSFASLSHFSSIQHFCILFLFSFYILSILSHSFLNQSIPYELAYFFFTNKPYSSPLYNFFVNIPIHLYCHYLFLLLLSLKHFCCLWILSIHLVPIGILDLFIYLLCIYTFCLNQFLSFYKKHPEHQLVIHCL